MKNEEFFEKRIKSAIELIQESDISIGYKIKIITSDQCGTWVFNSSWDPAGAEYCPF